jgi:hypothetical protein
MAGSYHVITCRHALVPHGAGGGGVRAIGGGDQDPDDPYLPPFVKGRAEALSMAIYERAKTLVAR